MSVSGSERVSSYGQISLVYKSPYSLHLYVDIFYVYKELDIIQHFYWITLIYNSSHTETLKKELFFSPNYMIVFILQGLRKRLHIQLVLIMLFGTAVFIC